MKPYKRISHAALTLLVAGALTAGGVVIESTNASPSQVSSMGLPASNSSNVNLIADNDSAQEKFINNEK